MKALLIWNNLWADRRVCFIHPLPGTSDLPVLRAENCIPSSHWWSAAPLLLPIISYLSLHSLTVLYSSCLSSSSFDSPPSFSLSCLLSVFSASPCALLFHLFSFHQFFDSTVFITSNSLSPFLFLLPSHFISIFPPLLLSSFSPYSEGIPWIIQKHCRMIMGN